MKGSRSVVAVIATIGIATFGLRVAAIAIPWFVLVSTGSAEQTGLVVAAELGPYVVCKAFTGPLVDSIGQRRVSIVSDFVSAALFGLIPLLFALQALPFPALLALVGVAGAARGPGDAAKHTLVPLTATAAEIPLTRATGMLGATERTAMLAAPALAAALIAAVGAPITVSLTAVCFAASGVMLAVFLRAPLIARADDTAPSASYLTRLRDGWAFLVRDRLLLGLGLMILFTNLLDIGFSSVLLPLWAETGGRGIGAVGVLLTCVAASSAVSSIVASWLGHRLPRRATYFLAFLIAGPGRFVVLAFDLPLGVMAAAMIVAGLGTGVINPIIGAMVYERIPPDKLGSVTAPLDALAWAGMPFGGVIAAALVAVAGLSPALLVLAGFYLVAIAVPAFGSKGSFDPPAAVAQTHAHAAAAPS